MTDGIFIRNGLVIPPEEVAFTTARSGGPGGQHVNKTSTRVTLWFDVERSAALGPGQKSILAERLAGRIGRDGRMRVVCGRHRSQAANRDEAIERFAALLREALTPRRPRRKSSVPTSERRRRLDDKRRRSNLKRRRGKPSDE